MKSAPHLYYYSPTTADELNRRFGADMYVGAAARKVHAVCESLNNIGQPTVIVSSSYSRPSGSGFFQALRVRDVPYIRILSARSRLLKRLASAIGFLLFTMRRVRKQDRVLLYNFFPEYLPAAFYLWASGRRAILDVEDGPRSDEAGLRGLVNVVSFRAVRWLASTRFVTVSNVLAGQLGLERFHCVYGVANRRRTERRKPELSAANETNVLYGGTIEEDTGLLLFSEAVKRLARDGGAGKIVFHITGSYDLEHISALRSEIADQDFVEIRAHQNLTAAAYNDLIENIVDVGLQLKLSGRSMSITTFPSKVVELLSAEIFVISTDVSDIAQLFDSQCMSILNADDAEELAGVLRWCASNPSARQTIAANGKRKADSLFAPDAVARGLKDFIFESL